MNQNKLLPKWLRDLVEAIISSGHSCKPIVRTHRKIDRNERCRCGSGLKYKYCHYAGDVKQGIR